MSWSRRCSWIVSTWSRPWAREAFAAPDPWSGLVSFMERMAEIMAGDLGLRQMLMLGTYGRDLVAVARQRNAPLIERLVERAQAAGQLRADMRQTDIPFIVFVLAEATQLSRAVTRTAGAGTRPWSWTACDPPGEVTPLPVPAPRSPRRWRRAMQQPRRGTADVFRGSVPCPSLSTQFL